MSVIDVESLLRPVSGDSPAGADVEYDPVYLELEKLAQGTPESVMGNETKPAVEPDWREVKKEALDLFARTRDLRVAMILTTALLKEDGLPGFADGLALVRGFLERLWDTFYPKLDPSDNNDPTVRVNILKAFESVAGPGSGDIYQFSFRVREATLTNSRQKIGRFGFRDIQVAKGELPLPAPVEGKEGSTPPDLALIHAAFQDSATEDLQALQSTLAQSIDHLDGIDAALAAKTGGSVGPNMVPMKDILEQMKGVIDENLASRGIVDGGKGAEGAAAGTPEDGGAIMSRGGGVALSGEIASRADVVRVLDKICEYYERFEPGSPVPIFIKRAKRLVTMNFVDVIKDLAPEALQKIEVFTGAAEGPTT
jgi:type VI secretion system protein ImpA